MKLKESENRNILFSYCELKELIDFNILLKVMLNNIFVDKSEI